MRILFVAALLLTALSIDAKSDGNKAFEYEISAGVNIGGASPVPLPVEIRKVKDYSPQFNGVFEGNVSYFFDNSWGITTGVRFDEKGMKTDAGVKSYRTRIVDGDQQVSGYWTGDVHTTYSASYLTVPVLATYKLASRWKLRAGMYVSYLLGGSFSGYVSNGTLREGTPVGEKVVFEGEKTGSYDFSSDMRHWSIGLQLGATYRVVHHFFVRTDLTYNISNVFEPHFETISFKMHPIYANVGFGYKF